MEDNNKKNGAPDNEESFDGQEGAVREESVNNEETAEERVTIPTEGDEFGPEAFEDEEPVEASPQSEAAAAQTVQPAKANPLPWFLFAASLVAIAVILYLGQNGLSGTAAKINGEKVSKQELYDIMFKQSGDAALDSLITEKLIAQEVDKKKVKVEEADIEAELKTIKGQFPDEDQFNNALKQSGYTLETLKNQIRTEAQVNKIFESQMDLSDTKLKEYFDKNVSRYDAAEQLEVSHILVEKKEDADKLLADLKAGADFAAVAKEKSTDPGSKDNGGSLGFVSRGQGLDQAFEDAAFKLNKGELSQVVQSSFGYHIIKVTDKKEAVKANFEEKKADVRKNMVQEEVQTKASEWLENLKKDAKIEKL
jgi:foldase protein PrsA